MNDYEVRLDELFTRAFETNHPAMLDYALLKMDLKQLRRVLGEAVTELHKTYGYGYETPRLQPLFDRIHEVLDDREATAKPKG